MDEPGLSGVWSGMVSLNRRDTQACSGGGRVLLKIATSAFEAGSNFACQIFESSWLPPRFFRKAGSGFEVNWVRASGTIRRT